MLTSLKPHQAGTLLANGIDLYYETFGDPSNPAVLLIMGLSCQCLQWFPYLVEPIVDRGYYVIRFDNRDIGLSTWIAPDDWQKNPYSLEDLAKDSVELLQALGIDRAHIISASMGGAIAQRIAISYPFPLDVPLYTELYRESVDVRKGYNPNCMVHQLAASDSRARKYDSSLILLHLAHFL